MNVFASSAAPVATAARAGADDEEPASARMRRYEASGFGETTAVHKRAVQPIEKHVFQPGSEPQRCIGLPTEIDRVRLIGELSRILHEPEVPESMKAAGLTLIGWLARRMPGEDAHALGVPAAAKKRR